MPIYGLSVTGFLLKSFEVIQDEITASLQSLFGNDIKTTGDSVLGQFIGVFTDQLSNLWEQVEAVFLAQFPEFATGQALDFACSLVGVYRLLGQKSTAIVTLGTTGGASVIIPINSIVQQSSNGVLWQTLNEVTIPPFGTVDVTVETTLVGEYTASIGSIDTIINLTLGWDTVTNSAIAVVGRNRETDTELRSRRDIAIVTAKGGTIKAIINRLRTEVSGVSFASGRENRTAVIDVNNLAPHSYDLVVVGGTNADVAQKIYDTGGDGIETNGTIAVNVPDTQGNNIVIRFNRATLVDIWFIVNKTVDSTFPVDGNQLIKDAMVAYGESFINGEDVLNWRMMASLDNIPGIITLSILQGFAPVPTLSNNLSIIDSQIANIQAVNITVN